MKFFYYSDTNFIRLYLAYSTRTWHTDNSYNRDIKENVIAVAKLALTRSPLSSWFRKLHTGKSAGVRCFHSLLKIRANIIFSTMKDAHRAHGGLVYICTQKGVENGEIGVGNARTRLIHVLCTRHYHVILRVSLSQLSEQWYLLLVYLQQDLFSIIKCINQKHIVPFISEINLHTSILEFLSCTFLLILFFKFLQTYNKILFKYFCIYL